MHLTFPGTAAHTAVLEPTGDLPCPALSEGPTLGAQAFPFPRGPRESQLWNGDKGLRQRRRTRSFWPPAEHRETAAGQAHQALASAMQDPPPKAAAGPRRPGASPTFISPSSGWRGRRTEKGLLSPQGPAPWGLRWGWEQQGPQSGGSWQRKRGRRGRCRWRRGRRHR